MSRFKQIILLSFLTTASLLYAYEPSVYGAGDIDSARPYGLTKTEQNVLENKKTVQMLYNKVTEQQRKIDGLTTIIEGQNKAILELKEQLSVRNANAYQATQENNATYALLLEMGQVIDEINSTYVTKDELETALVAGGTRPQSSTLGVSVRGGNVADTYRKAVELFSKRSYQAAKAHFETVLADNYKPAATNYYLGEVAYYTHQYDDAVRYYKTSASHYDKAAYMDVLYLHTAISLDKIGEKEQAKSFYQYVISTYPNKKSASIARNRLSK